MKFYNNVFASTYKYYSKFKNEAPRGSAIAVIAVCQITLILLLLAIIKRVTGYSFTSFHPYRYISVVVFFVWLYALYKYYSKERTETIIEGFNNKSLSERKTWAVVALLSFLLPMILFFIVLIKK